MTDIPDSIIYRILKGDEPIRVWREQRSLSIALLAERSDIDLKRMADIESGAIAPEEAEMSRLAGVLGVRAADLLCPPDHDWDSRAAGEGVAGEGSQDDLAAIIDDEIPW